jgi:hypothetical protein
VAITSLVVKGETGRFRVRFTTRSGQQAWYDERQERWENRR